MRPQLLALKTAVPSHVLLQSDVRAGIAELFRGRRDIERLLHVFDNAGIRKRHSCVPIGWYSERHGWSERTQLYLDHAVTLLERVARECIEAAGMSVADIDAVVVVSTTGIATPSLDALLIERMQLRRDVQRLPIFGLGCAGGVVGLARAAALASANPGGRVLFLVVELCALTFRLDDVSKSNIVAAALFGDGAAGAILSCADGRGASIGPAGEYTWPDSLGMMGWDVEEDGLKARFSQNIPTLVRTHFREALQAFFGPYRLSVSSFDGFACHPGGAKVLDALEEALGLGTGALEDSRAILRDYGNMSAATALFVLERMQGKSTRTLMSALGPGFTAGFLVLDSDGASGLDAITAQ